MSEPITRKYWEYKNFLGYIKEHKPQRAMIYAKALGIDRRTLQKWMEQPELREAMTEAVDAILEEMQKAGKNDWRMWDKMLELSGVTTVKEVDVTSDGESINPLAGLTTDELRKLINDDNPRDKTSGKA